MALNYTSSEENYLKAIFHLQGEEDTVTTNVLADKLQTKPASVTDMMKKLRAYYHFVKRQQKHKECHALTPGYAC